MKNVLVIGGGSWGSCLAKLLVENGNNVYLWEYNKKNRDTMKKERKNPIFLSEVKLPDELKIIDDYCEVLSDEEKYGKIDALVNSAYPRNKNYGKHFFEVTYDDFCENLGMNLGGYFLTSQLFAKYFYEQGFGNIINLASIYGVIAPRFEIYDNTRMTTPVEYAAIKSGLIHLSKYMAKYFKGKNIRVNTISLGGIEDKQPEPFLKAYKEFCLNKGMLNAKDISGTVLYLLSDLSEFVNGQNIVVDDGFTL